MTNPGKTVTTRWRTPTGPLYGGFHARRSNSGIKEDYGHVPATVPPFDGDYLA